MIKTENQKKIDNQFYYVTTLSKYPMPDLPDVDNIILLKMRTPQFKKQMNDIIKNSKVLDEIKIEKPITNFDLNVNRAVKVNLVSRIQKPYVFDKTILDNNEYFVIRYQHLVFMGRNIPDKEAHNIFLKRLIKTYNFDVVVPVSQNMIKMNQHPKTVVVTLNSPPVQPVSFKIDLDDFYQITGNTKVGYVTFVDLEDEDMLYKPKTLTSYVFTAKALAVYKRIDFKNFYTYSDNPVIEPFLKNSGINIIK